MNTSQINQVIEKFAAEEKNAGCMGTRRDAVMFLARKIGRVNANHVAEVFGLRNSFYFTYVL